MPENRKKLLLIDDNIQTIEMLQIILEDEGYEVITAYVGEDGLKKTAEEKPDLVILDVMLPGMNGYQVCEKIKNNPDTKDIPVIMLTGRDTGNDFDKAMEKKADWYVVKPYNIEHLLGVMKKLIKNNENRSGK